jgi:hypothetical protein
MAILFALAYVVYTRNSYQSTQNARTQHAQADYSPQRTGYKGTTVHSAVGWKSVTTVLDKYSATGDGAALVAAAAAKQQRALRRCGQWVREHAAVHSGRRKVCLQCC